MIELFTGSPEETQAIGIALGQVAKPGDLLLLCGDLGSGKTCLVQGIARGLGIQEPVRSPTFVLVTEHRGRLDLYHMDLYRLDDIREVEDLGLDEYLEGEGICAVEWADKALPFFPGDHLKVELEHQWAQRRALRLVPTGLRYISMVEQAHHLLAASEGRPHTQ